MRSTTFLGLALAAMFMAGNALSAASVADPLAGLRFADGKSHSGDDYRTQSLFVVYFCAH
jgi:hypothetical protein